MISLRSKGPAQMPQNIPKELTLVSKRDALLLRRAQSAGSSEPFRIFDDATRPSIYAVASNAVGSSNSSSEAGEKPAGPTTSDENASTGGCGIPSSTNDVSIYAGSKRRASALTERSSSDINANITSLFDSIAAKKPSKYAAAAKRERVTHGNAHTHPEPRVASSSSATSFSISTTATATACTSMATTSSVATRAAGASAPPPLSRASGGAQVYNAGSGRGSNGNGIVITAKATPPSSAPILSRSSSIDANLPKVSSSQLFRTPPALVNGHTASGVQHEATPKVNGPEMISPTAALDIEASHEYIIDFDSMAPPSMQKKDSVKYDPTYAKCIDNALRDREEAYLQPRCMFTAIQVEITMKEHAELVEWMSEVCSDQNLEPDTFYLSVHTMDAILSSKAMKKSSFQLLGAASLLLASKLEEVQALSPDLIVSMAGHLFSPNELIRMETFILNTLNYNVNIPTRLNFLERFIHIGRLTDREANFARYLVELSLYDYKMYRFRLSKVAAAAVNLAKQTLRSFREQLVWDKTLSYYSEYEDSELVDAVQALQSLHARSDTQPYLSSLVQKYESPEKHVVSRIICPVAKDFRYSSSVRSKV